MLIENFNDRNDSFQPISPFIPMSRKVRHIFSTLLSALIYFIFRVPTNLKKQPEHSSIKIIDEKNFNELRNGEWIIITDKFQFEDKTIYSDPFVNYGLLIVDSMNKAKIAALLGLQNPKNHIKIKNGVIISSSSNKSMATTASFDKILDYFVYYWAIDLKKIFLSATGTGEVIENFSISILWLLAEILKYNFINQ